MIAWSNINNKIKQFGTFNVLLVLVLITIPLDYAHNSIAVIALFVYSIISFFKVRRRPFFSKKATLLISVFVLSLVSFFWTVNTKLSSFGIQKMLSYLIIPLSFSLVNPEEIKKVKLKIVSLFAYFLSFYCFICIVLASFKYISTKDKNVFFYHELSNNLFGLNAIYLSVFVSFSFFVFFLKKDNKKGNYFFATFLLGFLFLLSSKSLISCTILFVCFVLVKKSKKIRLKLIFIIFAFISSLFFLTKNINKRVLEEFDNTHIDEVLHTDKFGHNYLWTGVGLRVFQQKAFIESIYSYKLFFLGYGINASQEKLDSIYKKYDLYHGFYGYNYHNQYLQTFSEIGFLGLSLILLLLFLSLKQAIQRRNLLYVAFVCLIIMVFLTEAFAWRAKGMIFMITILMIFDSIKKYQVQK